MGTQDDIFDYIVGNLEHDKKEEVMTRLKEVQADREIYQKAKIAWALMSSTKKMRDYDVEKSYKKLHSRISHHKSKKKLLRSVLKYAAILFSAVIISQSITYISKRDLWQRKKVTYSSVVAEKGQISKVILPDSSTVWLNSGSTITFNNNFGQDNRDIKLIGQAFLDVKKNIELPLVVSNGNLRIKVKGTRFDVCAYPDEKNIQVFLESGKVELNTEDKSMEYTMNPGEIADYEQDSGKLSIEKIKGENYSDWKGGELIFRDSPLTEVVKQLERKYDIKFIINNPLVYKSEFNARFKTESLKEVMDYIQFSSHVNYRMLPRIDGEKPKIELY